MCQIHWNLPFIWRGRQGDDQQVLTSPQPSSQSKKLNLTQRVLGPKAKKGAGDLRATVLRMSRVELQRGHPLRRESREGVGGK
jgi:hypothetical protein